MAVIGNLVVNLAANTSNFIKGMGQASAVTQAFSGVAAKVFVGAATSAAVGLATMAAQAEAVATQFEVMLGSGEMAASMLATIDELGAKSPFGAANFQEAAKTMLQFGVATDQILPAMTALGDVAAGDANKLSSLALVFSQMSATGRLMGQDLLQFINAGFNPLQEISKATGETMAELKKRMEDGGVSALEVSAALKAATSEGGRFYGMTERINKTVAGTWMQIQDEITMLGREMGRLLLPMAQQVLSIISATVSVFRDYGKQILIVGTAVTVFVAAMVALTTATMAYSKAKAIALSLTGPKGWAILAGAAVVAGVAVAGLTYSMRGVNNELKAAQMPIGKLKGEFAGVGDSAKQSTKDITQFQSRMEKLTDIVSGMVPETQKVIGKVKEFESLLAESGEYGVVTALHPLVKQFTEQESGFTDMMSSMTDELAILRGEATETGLKLQKMLEMGVDPKRIEEYKSMFAQLEQEKATQAGKEFFENKKAEMQSMADSILESLRTPEEILREKQLQFEELVQGGFLTQVQADAAMKKAKEDLGIGTEDKKSSMTKFAGAMQQGSAEAYSAIVQAMTRQSDPTVKELKKQTKDTVAAIKDLGKKFKEGIAGPVVQDFGFGGAA